MGVPTFFAWLAKKYSVVSVVTPRKPAEVNGHVLEENTDLTQPNCCATEFHCLYLDLNAIIHPACHPEHGPAPETEEAMFLAIFKAIDHIFDIIRPRRLLYLAVDGVAPRAKMNQQRARRFRAAQEAQEAADLTQRKLDELQDNGVDCSLYFQRKKQRAAPFDSNCITPGTEFMDRLSAALRFYVAERVSNEPAWRQLYVILSDSNVPGEGEHKIMDFIRRQRASPAYDPNMRHVLFGGDADLIMLGLATHEPAVYVLRENLRRSQPACKICGAYTHETIKCNGTELGVQSQMPQMLLEKETFLLVDLAHLRNCLRGTMPVANSGPKFTVDQFIDDWIFLCYFVGNDFLPHLPSLSIQEGAIDTLISLYNRMRRQLGGNINEDGIINLSRLELFLNELGRLEDQVCRKRVAEALSASRRAALESRKDVMDPAKYRAERAFRHAEAERDAAMNKMLLPEQNIAGISLPDELLPAELREEEAQKAETAKLRARSEPSRLGPTHLRYRTEQPESAAAAAAGAGTTVTAASAATASTGECSADDDRARREFENFWIPQVDGNVEDSDEDAEEEEDADEPATNSAQPAANAGHGQTTKRKSKKKKKRSRPSTLPGATASQASPAPSSAQPAPQLSLAERILAAAQATQTGSAFAMAATANTTAATNTGEAKEGSAGNKKKKAKQSKTAGKSVATVAADASSVVTAAATTVTTEATRSSADNSNTQDGQPAKKTKHVMVLKLPPGTLSGTAASTGGDDAKGATRQEGKAVNVLDTENFKEMYYTRKFGHSADNAEFIAELTRAYVRGLCWVAQYYYGPCPSWDFYYPYHYAPFASDFGSLKGVSAKFEKGSQPVRPLEQLMNVFPAGNAHYLPPSWGMLMTDPNSPLREYFPSNVVTDFNGKKYAWQGVVLLPFMDAKLLSSLLEGLMGDLTAAERRRNRIGADLLLVHQDHPLRPWLEANCPAVQPEEEDGDAKRTKLVNEFDMLAWPFVGHKPAPQPVTMKELPTDVFTPPAPLQGLAFASPMQPPLVCGETFNNPPCMSQTAGFVNHAVERGYVCSMEPSSGRFLARRANGAKSPPLLLLRSENPTTPLKLGGSSHGPRPAGALLARSIGLADVRTFEDDRREQHNRRGRRGRGGGRGRK